jgi:hypothetical protein
MKKYYPEVRFSGADLIALPLYNTIINRITNSLRTQYTISDAKVDALYSKYNINNILMDSIKTSLITGSSSI